ncbi:hypothetical protein [Dolosigranulum savutiense]|uniref:DUF4868 domain-containing protein n=1 Tax=Dolosigranulum savutiense TaxID=3110288 RepID=A0AB74TZ96_9LACT
MKKEVHFYKLVLKKRSQMNLFEDNEFTLADKVQQFSENYTDSDRVQVNGNKIVSLITCDKNHIFGNFGKLEDYNDGHHVRGRNKENYKIEDVEYFVETYSYFYIDLENNNIALLKRSGLPDIKKPLIDFLSFHFKISGNWKVDVVPRVTDTIDNIIGKRITIDKINYKVANEHIPQNDFASIKEALDISNNEINDVTVTLNFKKGTETTIDKILDKFKKFSEMKLKNDQATIDVVEKIITKKSFITIEKEDIHIQETIKKLLLSALRTES